MADQFPGSRFLGIDASARQIDDGQRILGLSGLTNVELRYQDILDFSDDQPFDYILCHGVYSWVPDAVQRRILQICQQHLTPNGVAYVSYNTYPGWHMRGMIRDIMRYRAQRFDDPRQKLSQARGLLTFLSNSVKGEDNPYGLLLRKELESIDRADDSYLLHEHLEEVNEPIYFHEFAERAKQAGLQYLGEADFGVMSVENFPEPVQGMLLSVSSDVIETEQYMDFLRNRAFRQTLLVRENVELHRTPDVRTLLRLEVASSARLEPRSSGSSNANQPAAADESPRANDTPTSAQSRDAHKSPLAVTFRRGTSVLRTSDPVVKAAMLHLGKVWPHSVTFAELASLARSVASGQPAAVDSDIMSAATERLASTLIRCFATSSVDLRSAASQFVNSVSERPRASSLARVQASQGMNIANRRHEIVQMDDIQRRIVAACDGTRTPSELVQSLGESLARNEFVLHHEGRRVTDAAVLPKLVGDLVPKILEFLAARAMLTG